MTPLVWLLVIWSALTTVLVILLIYRSTLTMHEDDQLFLDDAEAHMQQEQVELMQKVNRLSPVLRWLGAASGALILVIASMAVYQGMVHPQ
jgi:hypothetical protein